MNKSLIASFVAVCVLLVIVGGFFSDDEVVSDIEINPKLLAEPAPAPGEVSPFAKQPQSEAEQTALDASNQANNNDNPQPQPHNSVLTNGEMQQRQVMYDALLALKNCKQTQTCPQDESSPRSAHYALVMDIQDQLEAYLQFHQDKGYFDEETAAVTREFVAYPDGHVQTVAIDLMQAQPANQETAMVLIEALQSSYDGKIMTKAMQELQRYPQLAGEIQALYAQHLKHGAFNVARELAKNLAPHIDQNNLAFYKQLAEELPPRSAKARLLKSSILEAEYRIAGG